MAEAESEGSEPASNVRVVDADASLIGDSERLAVSFASAWRGVRVVSLLWGKALMFHAEDSLHGIVCGLSSSSIVK